MLADSGYPTVDSRFVQMDSGLLPIDSGFLQINFAGFPYERQTKALAGYFHRILSCVENLVINKFLNSSYLL